MSLPGPYFHAWCDDKDRVNAYLAALATLSTPKAWSGPPSLEEALSKARAAVQFDFAAKMSARGGLSTKLPSGQAILLDLEGRREGHNLRYSCGPLLLQPDEQRELVVHMIEIAGGGLPSVEVEAAVLSLVTLENIEDLVLRLCAPEDTKRVTTGTCTWIQDWGPPILGCATYNAEAHVVRDLALSWINLHDKADVEHLAGLSMKELRARVEDTPPGSHIRFASETHLGRRKEVDMFHLSLPTPMSLRVRDLYRSFVGDVELTREQVLAALATSPATQFEALEAAAVADDEWRAVEPLALEAIEAKKQGAPTLEIDVSTGKHRRFIEQHAPYHVRRLSNGGVLLATHPYRTLWQLWADALLLLGIRT